MSEPQSREELEAWYSSEAAEIARERRELMRRFSALENRMSQLHSIYLRRRGFMPPVSGALV